MSDCIIDCCSLLNLYIGWSGLEELRGLNHTWHICEAGLAESEFTREYGPEGIPIDVALDLSPLIDSALLHIARPETDAELTDYVNFAGEVDDGEAQALAIAKSRKYILLTDDRKATRIATRADVGVQTLTTVGVLRMWYQHTSASPVAVKQVIERIDVLARFAPAKGSADMHWWRLQLDN